jgi:hypothetical protein
MTRAWLIGALVALCLCAIPRPASAQWQAECAVCGQHLGGGGILTASTEDACNTLVAEERNLNYPFGKCHAVEGTSDDQVGTGTLQGDVLALGANSWLTSHIDNPYALQFAQEFTKSFLRELFSSTTPEARRQREQAERLVQQRQAEAAARARALEQQRLDAMFARLNSQLKLDGHSTRLTAKSDGAVQNLTPKLSAATGDSGLKLKLGDEPAAGIPGLPGIYVGGPVQSAQDSASGGLKLKLGDEPGGAGIAGLPGIYVGGPVQSPKDPVGDGNASKDGYGIPGLPGIYVGGPSTAGATPAVGIDGLPGLYLDNAEPADAARLAATAQTLTGAERATAQDVALQAAQRNPDLTRPTDDPLVKDYQQQVQAYSEGARQRDAALQAASEAEGHVLADQAAIDYATGQVGSAADDSPIHTTLQQMVTAALSDEAVAATARSAFDQTEINLSIVRGRAADALARLAPAALDGATPSLLRGTPAINRPATLPTLGLVRVPLPAALPRVEDDRETQAFLAAAKKACEGSSRRNCEFLYAQEHKNDIPALYLSRRNAEHYLFAKSTCQGTPGAEWTTLGVKIPTVAVTPLLAGAIAGYSAQKVLWNFAGSSTYVNSPASLQELRWEFTALGQCVLPKLLGPPSTKE